MCAGGRGQGQAGDALAWLHELVIATDELRHRLGLLFEGGPLTHLRGSKGMSYEQNVPLNRRLQIIEFVSDAFEALSDAGRRFWQAEAITLDGEGMTMDEIAVVLGVSRQRVSALLRQAPRSRPGFSPAIPLSVPSARRERHIRGQSSSGKVQ